MKARIHKNCPSGLHWGQIYDKERKGWRTVTIGCITEWGAKRELEKWRKVHCPEEFEI